MFISKITHKRSPKVARLGPGHTWVTLFITRESTPYTHTHTHDYPPPLKSAQYFSGKNKCTVKEVDLF